MEEGRKEMVTEYLLFAKWQTSIILFALHNNLMRMEVLFLLYRWGNWVRKIRSCVHTPSKWQSDKAQAYTTNVDNVGIVSKMLGGFPGPLFSPKCWLALKSPPHCFVALA